LFSDFLCEPCIKMCQVFQFDLQPMPTDIIMPPQLITDNRTTTNLHNICINNCHAMLCISTAIVQCPSVHLSVTFVHSVKTNKDIFSPSRNHTILVFPYQTLWQYSDGNPLMRASNASGVGRNYDSEPISGFTGYSAAEYCAPVWSRSAHTSQVDVHCAVELYHPSHLWYPLFYISPMASSALQH